MEEDDVEGIDTSALSELQILKDEQGNQFFWSPSTGGVTYIDQPTITIGDDTPVDWDTIDKQLGEAYKASGISVPTGFSKWASGLLKKATTPAGVATAIAGLYSVMGGNKPQMAGYKGSIPNLTAVREAMPQTDYKPYTGETVMGRQYFTPIQYVAPTAAAETQAAAKEEAAKYVPPAPPPITQPEVKAMEGGLMSLAQGRYLRGPTDGMADKIKTSIDGEQPARLSHGEFVVPADVVSHLGNGNSDAGADVLYKMMDRVRQARTGTTKQGKEINPEKFTPGGIAYAGGGSVRNFQSGGTTSNPANVGSAGSTSAAVLSEFAGPYVSGMLGRAQALAQTPYQAYTGPLSAGYSPLQQKFFSGLGSMDFPTFGKSFTDEGIAQSYMNPYMQQILAPQMQAMQRQSDIQRSLLGAQAARAGAFGGARSGLMQNQLAAELMRQQQQATGQAYGQAYQTGLGQFNLEQQRAQDLANLMGMAGGVQRDIEQQGIAARRGQFEEERKFPYAQLQFQQSMLQGLPIGATQYTPNTTGLGQISDVSTKLAALYDMLSKAGFGLPEDKPK